MNMHWSLDALYSSFECEELKNDLTKCYEETQLLGDWADSNLNSADEAVGKAETYLKSRILIEDLLYKLQVYSYLTSSTDSKNENAAKLMDNLQGKISELTKSTVAFQDWLCTLDDLSKLISSSSFLKEHEFYLMEIVRKKRYALGKREEMIVSKMSVTGANAWSRLHQVLSSTLMAEININGKDDKVPVAALKRMAFDKDPVVRKTAYEASLKAYSTIEDSAAAALNSIKGQSLVLSELRGYGSPLEASLAGARMHKETLDAMYTAVKEKLPVFRKYLIKKSEILGYKNGLPYYELFAPITEINLTYTYEEAREYIIKAFKTFSDTLADFADNTFKNSWIDAEPRKGKSGGAFCLNIPSIKESRILVNFNGNFDSLKTLAHELGHAYHGKCLYNESILNTEYPKPIAETASIMCETLLKNIALEKSNPQEAYAILESSLQSYSQIIVDVYSAFLFENKVFELRKDHPLSAKELNELMMEAQREAYGEALDPNYLNPYTWLNKPHYFSPTLDFYNYPYTFGELFAKGIYAEYLRRGDSFIDDYDKFLTATGKNNITDVCSMINIDVHSADFWRNSLSILEEEVNKFLSLGNIM